jgi:hypothetical protein
MGTMEYSYWEVKFISCEGNERWTIARTPSDWEEWQLWEVINLGGCGDDPAEIISIEESQNNDWCWYYDNDDMMI